MYHLQTAANLPSGLYSRVSDTTKEPLTRSCASSIVLGEMSNPTTWKPALDNISETGIPVPQPTSRTLEPEGSMDIAF